MTRDEAERRRWDFFNSLLGERVNSYWSTIPVSYADSRVAERGIVKAARIGDRALPPDRNRRSMMKTRIGCISASILICAGLLAGACDDPNNIYVDASASGPGDGSPESPFQRIGQGLFWVASGGTVHVAQGDYNENLVILRPMKLQGAGSETTRLLADVTEIGIEIKSSDVKVSGFSIAGQGDPDIENQMLAGIWAENVNNLIIRENEVGFYSSCGICVREGSNITIETNQVSWISEVQYDPGVGIGIAEVDDLVLRDNLAVNIIDGFGFTVGEINGLMENNVSSANGVGILVRRHYADETDSFVMRGNLVEANRGIGLGFLEAIVSEFFDNTILNNWGTGLTVLDVSYVGCVISGGPNCDELLRTEILDCGDNQISGNYPDFDGWVPDAVRACFQGGG